MRIESAWKLRPKPTFILRGGPRLAEWVVRLQDWQVQTNCMLRKAFHQTVC